MQPLNFLHFDSLIYFPTFSFIHTLCVFRNSELKLDF